MEDLHEIQGPLKQTFQYKIIYTCTKLFQWILLIGIFGRNEQTHKKVHRSFNENIEQTKKMYY